MLGQRAENVVAKRDLLKCRWLVDGWLGCGLEFWALQTVAPVRYGGANLGFGC